MLERLKRAKSITLLAIVNPRGKGKALKTPSSNLNKRKLVKASKAVPKKTITFGFGYVCSQDNQGILLTLPNSVNTFSIRDFP